jgi:phage-related protein
MKQARFAWCTSAKLTDAVYVLHCFQKKTQQTAKRDIDLARQRLKALLKELAP